MTMPSTRIFLYLLSRTRYWTWSKLRFLLASSSSSSSLAAQLTYPLETSSPQSSLIIAATLCVETTLDNHFCEGSFRALLLRSPRSNVER